MVHHTAAEYADSILISPVAVDFADEQGTIYSNPTDIEQTLQRAKIMPEKAEILYIPLVAGPCPDSDFCTNVMGYCMSGCSSGPGPESQVREERLTETTNMGSKPEDTPLAVSALEQVLANR